MSANSISAGFSRIEITPPLEKFQVWGLGYWFQRSVRFIGIRDPLYVRALALGDGKTCQLILSLDAIFDTYGLIEKAGPRIAQELALPAENVFITCTHTHSTPVIHRNNTILGAEYGPYVVDRMVACAHEAFEKREAMFASLCRGRVAGVLHNRRPLLKDGRVAELHTTPDPEAIADPGPVNDTLTLLKLRRPGGELAGGICHFGIHGVAIQCSDLISSDCMGRAIQRFELEADDAAVMLHLNGACADIDPIAMGDAEALDTMTDRLLAGLRSVSLAEEQPITMTPQKTISGSFSARRRNARGDRILLQPEQRGASTASPSLSHHSGSGYESFLLEEERAVSTMPEKIDIPYQVLRMGDLVWVGVGGEVFTCSGLQLAMLSQRSTILPVGITGGCWGYLPPEIAFSQGGYEVACARWCPIAPGETEKLFAKLENELHLAMD